MTLVSVALPHLPAFMTIRDEQCAWLSDHAGDQWYLLHAQFDKSAKWIATYKIEDPDVAMLFKLTFGGE